MTEVDPDPNESNHAEPPNELAQLRILQAPAAGRRVADEALLGTLALASCISAAPKAFLLLTQEAIKALDAASSGAVYALGGGSGSGGNVRCDSSEDLCVVSRFDIAKPQAEQDDELDGNSPIGVTTPHAPVARTASDPAFDRAMQELAFAHFGASFSVADAKADVRFADFVLVTGPEQMRGYAGVPLVTTQGSVMGMLCVLDTQPRAFSEAQIEGLRALARQAIIERELRIAIARLKNEAVLQQSYQQQLEESQAKLEIALNTLSALNIIDPLTGVHNRRAFDELFATEHARAKRDGKPLSVVMVEIDSLSVHQEEFGRTSGNELLQKIAMLLRSNARPYDVISRYESERFVVVLPGTDAPSSRLAAERWRKAIASYAWEEGIVTVCLGVATSKLGQEAVDLVFAADNALFVAKARASNSVMHVDFLDA